ncbi:MAG: DUF2752 domain-containing protein [Clostridiales bacterium]|nr:DUF2752 domain-containing protein [Clostridiales bacterium]
MSSSMMNREQKRRAAKCLRSALLIFVAGLGYAAAVSVLHAGIPCLFHLLTGYKCPGCGVTHMCLALLEGDWESACQANPGLFFSLPVLAVFLFWYVVRYIRSGSRSFGSAQTVLGVVLVVYYLLYGIYGNL